MLTVMLPPTTNPPTSPCLRFPARGGGQGRSARQRDSEFGELAQLAIDFDRAAMLLGHDVIADRQAEAGALAGRLRCEKRLEQLFLVLRRYADAIVPHSN